MSVTQNVDSFLQCFSKLCAYSIQWNRNSMSIEQLELSPLTLIEVLHLGWCTRWSSQASVGNCISYFIFFLFFFFQIHEDLPWFGHVVQNVYQYKVGLTNKSYLLNSLRQNFFRVFRNSSSFFLKDIQSKSLDVCCLLFHFLLRWSHTDSVHWDSCSGESSLDR